VKKKEKNYYKKKAISNSSLSYIKDSPKLFKKFINGELETENKDYFELGTAVHMYFLEPDKFKKTYEIMDYTSPTSKNQTEFLEKISGVSKITDNILLNAYKECYIAKQSDDKILETATKLKNEYKNYIKYLKKRKNKTILRSLAMQLIRSMESNIKGQKTAPKLIYDIEDSIIDNPNKVIYNEKEVYWKGKHGLDYKAMLDRLIVDHANKKIKLVDLKTTKSVKTFITSSFTKYKYDRQLAFYSLAARELFKQEFKDKSIEDYEIEFYIVALDTGNGSVMPFKISQKIILNAASQIVNLLDRIYWHTKEDKWEFPMEYYLNDGVIEICEATLLDL
jgi:hypothetical protein